MAEGTAGFHDYPRDEESYQAALFVPSRFALAENAALAFAFAGDGTAADRYVTLTLAPPPPPPAAAGEVEPDEAASPPPVTPPIEMECRDVRGAGGSRGISCNNLPPSELLLLNRQNLRYTRTSVGGWTFQGATENLAGDSIFVEYGSCTSE